MGSEMCIRDRIKIILEMEIITDKIITDKIITDQVITDKIITDQVITDKIITDQVITDKIITDQVSLVQWEVMCCYRFHFHLFLLMVLL